LQRKKGRKKERKKKGREKGRKKGSQKKKKKERKKVVDIYSRHLPAGNKRNYQQPQTV